MKIICPHCGENLYFPLRSTFVNVPEKLKYVYRAMKNRCNNKKTDNFKNYGGRGIKLCEEWERNSKAFYDWAIKNGYKEGLQIDRINVDGDYCPENCRFVTPKENSNNRRNSIRITINGISETVSYWSNITGIKQRTLYRYAERSIKYAEDKISECIQKKAGDRQCDSTPT